MVYVFSKSEHPCDMLRVVLLKNNLNYVTLYKSISNDMLNEYQFYNLTESKKKKIVFQCNNAILSKFGIYYILSQI